MAMSERKCCVKGCDSSEALSEDGVIFYSFPESSNEPERWNSWVSAVSKNIGDSSWQPETNTVICSKHFLGGIKSDIKSQVSYVPTTFPHSDNLKDLNVVNAYKRVRQHSSTDEDDPLSNSNVCQTQTNTLREEADVSPPKKSARHEIEDSHKISEKMKTVASQTIMPLLQDTFEFVSSFYGNNVSCQCNIGLDLFEKKDIPSGCVNTFSVVDELCASSECEGEESSSQIFIKTEPHLEMEDEEGDAWSDKSQYQDIESDEHDPLITSITHFSIECEPDIIEGEHNPSNKEKPEFIENESTPSIKTDPELTEDGFNCSIKIEPDNPIGYGPDIETPSFFESGPKIMVPRRDLLNQIRATTKAMPNTVNGQNILVEYVLENYNLQHCSDMEKKNIQKRMVRFLTSLKKYWAKCCRNYTVLQKKYSHWLNGFLEILDPDVCTTSCDVRSEKQTKGFISSFISRKRKIEGIIAEHTLSELCLALEWKLKKAGNISNHTANMVRNIITSLKRASRMGTNRHILNQLSEPNPFITSSCGLPVLPTYALW